MALINRKSYTKRLQNRFNSKPCDCGIQKLMAQLYKLSLTALASNHSSRVLALSWSRDNFLCVATASLKGDVLRSDLNRFSDGLAMLENVLWNVL